MPRRGQRSGGPPRRGPGSAPRRSGSASTRRDRSCRGRWADQAAVCRARRRIPAAIGGRTAPGVPSARMERPIRFEHNRYVGDKRTQVVYDLDHTDDDGRGGRAELMAAETFICFGPDTLAEARNRGYRLARSSRGGTGGRRGRRRQRRGLTGGGGGPARWRSASAPTGCQPRRPPGPAAGPPERSGARRRPVPRLPVDRHRGHRPRDDARAGRPHRHRDGLGGARLRLPGMRRVRGPVLARRLARRHRRRRRPRRRHRPPARASGWPASAPAGRWRCAPPRPTSGSRGWPPWAPPATSTTGRRTPGACSSTGARSG